MTSPYPILDLSPPKWRPVDVEPGGTKKKFWAEDDSGQRVLFKFRRGAATGDHWAEKIAAEIAGLLCIPHAICELAAYPGEQGTLEHGIASFDFTNHGKLGLFVPGNELLLEEDPSYPKEVRYHVAAYTVDKVLSVLRSRIPTGKAGEMFLGYLMLDALISNQDRHHENWGVLQKVDSRPARMVVISRANPVAIWGPQVTRKAVLAPSFDHASSLGWNLQDEERSRRLRTRDRNYSVSAYVLKAASALYNSEGKLLSPLEAFNLAAEQYPKARAKWMTIARSLDEGKVWESIDRVPEVVMSALSKKFALETVRANLQNLIKKK